MNVPHAEMPIPQNHDGTWSVVATTLPDATLIEAFVQYHLSLGADEVLLFIDCETMPDQLLPLSHSQVRVQVCDAAYWQRVSGARPGSIQNRQLANCAQAHAHARSGWLLHCDTDEFLIARGPVAAALAALPAHVFSVLLPPCEAVYRSEPRHALEALATRLFRTPCPTLDGALAAELYGDCAQFTAAGLAGHRVGKSIVRCGASIGTDSPHRPMPADPALTALLQLDGFEIAHFHGISFPRWLAKWAGDPELRPGKVRRRGEHVKAAIERVHERIAQCDLDSLRETFRRLYVFDDPRRRELAAQAGLMVDREPIRPIA